MKTTAAQIKYALMFYFRFERQMLCATECHQCDVLAMSDRDLHEVEVKVSKHDLIRGESKKMHNASWSGIKKHDAVWREAANKFSIAVPSRLVTVADEWVQKTNPHYGIILFDEPQCITIRRSAKRLRDSFDPTWKDKLMMRLCTENIRLMRGELSAKVDGMGR